MKKTCAVSRLLFEAVVTVGAGILRLLLLGYFRVELRGVENLPARGPAIVAGNHPSLIDGLLLYLLSPVPLLFIAHRELFRHPLIGWLMRGLGFINARDRRQALIAAEHALDRGERVVIFPEGGAYDRGTMEEIHPGVGHLALRTAAPVILLGIAGAAEAYPLGTFLPRPRRIVMELAPAVRYVSEALQDVGSDELTATLIEIRRDILEVGARARARWLKPSPLEPWRPVAVLLSAIAFLPLVAVLTVLARDLEKPPG